MEPRAEPFDPYDESQRLPDPGRPRMVQFQALYAVAVAWIIVHFLGLLLLFLVRDGGAFRSARPDLPPWVGHALQVVGPALPMIALVVVALVFVSITTTDWNADDRDGVRMLTFIYSLLVGANR